MRDSQGSQTTVFVDQSISLFARGRVPTRKERRTASDDEFAAADTVDYVISLLDGLLLLGAADQVL